MGTEHFFRFLSIAILGLIALAAQPDTNAEPVLVEAVSQVRVDDELQAVLEVNEINAGRFNPYQAGDFLAGDASYEVSELDQMPPTVATH